MKFTKYLFLILGVLSVTILLSSCSNDNNTITGGSVANEASVNGDVVEIPLDSITDKMQKFNYDANGVTVTYFAVQGSDGEVRTAFDACDVCGGYKGYSQSGNDIECNNCGKVFLIDGLGTKNKGYGCWPSYLSHTIENGNVIIKTSELEQGSFRFA